MKRACIVIVGFVTVAASSPTEKAERFVDEFGRTCLVANGDFEAMKTAVKSAGFSRQSYLDDRPSSLYAKHGRHIIVYRGAPDPEYKMYWPNCTLQTDYIPGGELSLLASVVERNLGLGNPTKSATCQGRPVLKWQTERNGRPETISLVDDVLVGDRNLRLGISPSTDEKPDCKNFKQKIVRKPSDS